VLTDPHEEMKSESRRRLRDEIEDMIGALRMIRAIEEKKEKLQCEGKITPFTGKIIRKM